MSVADDLKDPVKAEETRKRAQEKARADQRQKVFDNLRFRDEYYQQKHEATRKAPVLVFDGDAEELVPPEWLIDLVLPTEGAGQLFGESDLGKTFVSLDMAVHVAAGKTWQGRSVKRGTVVFIEAEGGRAFARRKHAAKGAAGLGDGTQGELFERLPFVSIYQPLGFGPDTPVEEAVAYGLSIRKMIDERGLPPIRLAVADTLAQNIAGDADNNEEMSAFLRCFRAFLKALSDEPVFGLLIHHPGHKEKSRARGAYSLPADLDTILKLEGSRDALWLECDRQRDDEPFKRIPLKLERVTLTLNGEPMKDSWGREVTSLVVKARKVEAGEEHKGDPLLDVVLEALPLPPNRESTSTLTPKVNALLAKAGEATVAKPKVEDALCRLELDHRAKRGPGRSAGSTAWCRVVTQEEADL